MSGAGNSARKRKLGNWFPSASLIKSKGYETHDQITICLFYQYVRPLWTETKRKDVIKFIEDRATEYNIGGRVRVALEGLNSTLSGESENVRLFTKSLAQIDANFAKTDFKFIDDLPLDRAFKDMKVLPVQELVFYGIHAEEELGEGGASAL